MRIAVLTNDYPPSSGGAGRIAGVQAEWLARHGHEVQVWTVAPFTQAAESVVSVSTFPPRTSFSYRDLGKRGALARLLFHFEDLAPNLDAVDKIRAWQPAVLISHNVTGCGWGTARLLKDSGISWIHVLHDVQMFEPSGQRLYGESFYALRRVWRTWWAKRRQKALGQPDAVVSPTRWLLEQHRVYGLFNSIPSHVVPNPVDIPNFICHTHFPLCHPRECGDSEKENKNKIGWIPGSSSDSPEDDRKVLYVGRLSYDKGVDLLLNAWQSMSPRPGRLSLIGDGPMRQTCEKLNDPSIECLGPMEHAAVMEKMAASDLVVSASRVMENQPTVLLEAVALGKRVVATDVGGVRETLAGYGTIVKPDDAQALAAGIEKELSCSPDQESRKVLLAHHDQEAIMEKLAQLMSISIEI